MKEYIEKTLHLQTQIVDYEGVNNLPLYLRGTYRLYTMELAGIYCILARPTEKLNLATLRKNREQLSKLTGLKCVLGLDTVSAYARDKMIEEGIPFVVDGKYVYMPFLGVVLPEERQRTIKPSDNISFLTQKLLLLAIYEKLRKCSVSEMARKLDVAKMSVARCYDELEALDGALIKWEGRSRCFVWGKSSQTLFELVHPWLRNPVKKQYALDEEAKDMDAPLSGMSALSLYTLLSDNVYPTYALTREDAKRLLLKERKAVPMGEVPASVVQVLYYILPFGDKRAVDPITAVLTLTTDERADPRVEEAIVQLMEEYVYGEGA